MLSTEVVFSDPHTSLADRLGQLAGNATAAHIVTGFATVDGVRSLPLSLRQGKLLQTFVVGAGTQRAFDAFGDLLKAGVQPSSLFIHLGHTRNTTESATYKFLRYHPMLHSKLYLFEYGDQEFAAIIGSHNVTNYALNGLNNEVGVCLKGKKSEACYQSIVAHIEACRREAVSYEHAKRDAYAWWLEQFAEGLAVKAKDRERDYERRYTLILFVEGPSVPMPGSELYLELPAKLYQRSLTIDVHGYVFDRLPPDAQSALRQAPTARATFTGSLDGLVNKRGAVEILADWHIVGPSRKLTRTSDPFRPKRAGGFQQARVEIRRPISGTYVYLFDREPTWSPVYDNANELRLSESDEHLMAELNLIPQEHFTWHRVIDLSPVAEEPNPAFEAATTEAAGLFVLFSPRRAHFPP